MIRIFTPYLFLSWISSAASLLGFRRGIVSQPQPCSFHHRRLPPRPHLRSPLHQGWIRHRIGLKLLRGLQTCRGQTLAHPRLPPSSRVLLLSIVLSGTAASSAEYKEGTVGASTPVCMSLHRVPHERACGVTGVIECGG